MSKISIIDTATLIIESNVNRKNLLIKNVGSNTIYLGSDNLVTTSTGFPINPNEDFVNNDYDGDWYGIVSSGSEDVIVFEEDVE